MSPFSTKATSTAPIFARLTNFPFFLASLLFLFVLSLYPFKVQVQGRVRKIQACSIGHWVCSLRRESRH